MLERRHIRPEMCWLFLGGRGLEVGAAVFWKSAVNRGVMKVMWGIETCLEHCPAKPAACHKSRRAKSKISNLLSPHSNGKFFNQ